MFNFFIPISISMLFYFFGVYCCEHISVVLRFYGTPLYCYVLLIKINKKIKHNFFFPKIRAMHKLRRCNYWVRILLGLHNFHLSKNNWNIFSWSNIAFENFKALKYFNYFNWLLSTFKSTGDPTHTTLTLPIQGFNGTSDQFQSTCSSNAE